MAKPRSGSKKKVSIKKGTLSLNLKGVSGARKRIQRIPEGEYLAKVTGVTIRPGGGAEKSFKSGKGGVVWQVDIIHDSSKINGARFWLNNVIFDEEGNVMEDSLWTLRSTLESLDPKVKNLDKAIDIQLDRLKGREIGVDIADGEYQGKVRSEINQTFHPDQLETDDEEEDDEEEDEEEEEEDDEDEEEEEEEEDFDDDEEEEDDTISWEDVENADGLKELKAIAESLDVSIEPPKGKDRITQKILIARLERAFEEDDDDDEEIDLDDEDL